MECNAWWQSYLSESPTQASTYRYKQSTRYKIIFNFIFKRTVLSAAIHHIILKFVAFLCLWINYIYVPRNNIQSKHNTDSITWFEHDLANCKTAVQRSVVFMTNISWPHAWSLNSEGSLLCQSYTVTRDIRL